MVGDPDVGRSWAYLPDVAATLATLGTDERSLSRAWHVPSAPPRSQQQALTDLAEAMRVAPVRVSGIAWPVLRAVGFVVPMMREVVDVRHQFDQEFVIDATAAGDLRADRHAVGRRSCARQSRVTPVTV